MQRKYVILAGDGTSFDLARRQVFNETAFDLPDLLDQGWRPVRETSIGKSPYFGPDNTPLGEYSAVLILLEHD